MNFSPSIKLKRASSEPRLPRSISCSIPNRSIDPFSRFPQKHTKTLTIRPTCHKHTNSEKTFASPKLVQAQTKKNLIHPSTGEFKLPRKVVKKPNLRPKVQSGAFSAKHPLIIFQTVNPSFSAKNSERSTAEELKPCYRSSKEQMVRSKPKLKVPSLNKKMLKRVASVVFKEKNNKTSLNISFGDPECFPYKLTHLSGY